jgi:hypothetical protein
MNSLPIYPANVRGVQDVRIARVCGFLVTGNPEITRRSGDVFGSPQEREIERTLDARYTIALPMV